jgi:hypothetical protein
MRALDLFKGRYFDQEIIVLCVRWYLRFQLSSRDLVQMMAERGIALTHNDSALGAALCAGVREALEQVLSASGWIMAL